MIENFVQGKDDNSLTAAVKQRDQHAFGLLYDKYAPPMLGIILKMTGDKLRAEELLGECFVNIWNEISFYDDNRESLFIWLLNKARFCAANEMQATPAKSANTKNTVYTDAAEKKPEVMKQNNLSALDMVYCKGYSYDKAAAALKITAAECKKNG